MIEILFAEYRENHYICQNGFISSSGEFWREGVWKLLLLFH
jgi:hypothetical protein